MKTTDELWQEWFAARFPEIMPPREWRFDADDLRTAFFAGRASVNRQMAEEIETFVKTTSPRISSSD